MAKIVILTNDQIAKLAAGGDVELELSPKRRLLLGTKDMLTRKKDALQAKFDAKMAKLEGNSVV